MQGEYVAKVAGLPDLPRVQLPHPVAGRSADEMVTIADGVADAIVAEIRGRHLSPTPRASSQRA